MKYIITENKAQNIIERYIRSNYPEVINVLFKTTGVWLASEDKRIERTDIVIICDFIGILEGKKGGTYYVDKAREMRTEISDFFNLNIYEYGSSWDISVKQVTLVNALQ